MIRTPDHRLRVFVSSTLKELAEERHAVRQAILNLHLTPVMFESGARPHPAQKLYKAYLAQSHMFIGIYWQRYGWIAPGMEISGLEEEYNLSAPMPCLFYIKDPASDREPALVRLLERIELENSGCYKQFTTPDELRELVENDLALLLTEYFETARGDDRTRVDGTQHLPANVPTPRNSLVGRKQELARACDLLLRDDVGLVTLSGPGGTGKSRLAIQIALDLRERFTDGVYMVALESIRDPELVIPTIAKTIGLAESTGGPPLADLLKVYLGNKKILLFLDNFEQVLAAGPAMADLIEACPQVKVLITSRAPLHLRAERVLPVPPLVVPPANEGSDPQRLSQYSAVLLFIQRAQGVKSDFQVTNENAPAVAEICHRLEGLPLAIELAAARIRMLPPQALLARMENRFAMLAGGSRDLPERQRTLYGAIDWSYNLLQTDAKRLFRRLSVFLGGWTLEAVDPVCNIDGEPPIEVFDGLDTLVDNNLLKPPEEVDGELRFGMLETIRGYASEQLALSGDEQRTVQCKHIEYYRGWAEQALPEIQGARQVWWLDRLEREHDNLRAALNRSIETGMLETTLSFGVSLWRFWAARGHVGEGRRWFETAFALLSAVDLDNVPLALRASAFNAAGALARIQCDLSQAKRYHQSALDLRRRAGDRQALGRSLNNLAIVLMWEGSYAEAQHLLEESSQIAREMKDEVGVVKALNNLGVVEMYLTHFDRALQLHGEVLGIYRKQEDEHGVAGSLGNMGDVLRYQGNYTGAQSVLEESLRLLEKMQDRQGMGITLGSLGRVALGQKDAQRCEEYYLEGLRLLREVDDRTAMPDCFEGLAAATSMRSRSIPKEARQSDVQRAVELCAAAAAMREASGAPLPPTDRAEYEQTLALLRTELDPATYATAWSAGQAMTLDEALELALEGQGNPDKSRGPVRS